MTKIPMNNVGLIKENIILKLQNNPNKTFKKNQLFYSIGLKEKEERILFDEAFDFLIKNKIILSNKNKKIRLNLDEEAFIGKIYFSPKGFAFVKPFKSSKENFFVPKDQTLNSMHEDKVIAIKTKDKNKGVNKRAEAKILFVIHRSISELVGTYMSSENFGFVIPDDNRYNLDIYIPKEFENGAKSYDKVIVAIDKYPERKRKPEGRVKEILGLKWDKGIDALSVIKANEIRDKFPPEVLKETSLIKTQIPESEIKRRKDFRNEIIFTIDGADAKDLDDAISIKKDGDLYELGVHIADVSHYVKEGSEIDKEALKRGTSIYLINKVIPMLPKVISNNVCSLNVGTDKLAISLIMKIDKHGKVIKHDIYESIISSKARLTYEEVTNFLNGSDDRFEEKYPSISKDLLIAKELSEILKKKRDKRGSIEFDLKETQIILDEEEKVVDIRAYDRGISNDIIEEFMLVANETIAKKFCNLEVPFIYRVHSYPRTEKLENFKNLIEIFGYEFNYDLEEIEPIELKKIIEKIEESSISEPLKMYLLRCMKQARYSSECKIHYGLASEYYCHFTSPIRRYPDLQIHRIIKLYLNGFMNRVTKEKYKKIVEEVSKSCSRTERIAEKAEKELYQEKMNEYMLSKKTETFNGFIRSFNNAGMFVVLDNTIEGFVKEVNIEFNEEKYTAKLSRLDIELKLGDRVVVKPKTVNVGTKEIQFNLIEVL